MTRYLSGLCVAGLGLCGGGWLVVAAVAFGGESAGRAGRVNLVTGAVLIAVSGLSLVCWSWAWRQRMRADGVLAERFLLVSRREARRNRRALNRDVRREAKLAERSARGARRAARRSSRLGSGGALAEEGALGEGVALGVAEAGDEQYSGSAPYGRPDSGGLGGAGLERERRARCRLLTGRIANGTGAGDLGPRGATGRRPGGARGGIDQRAALDAGAAAGRRRRPARARRAASISARAAQGPANRPASGRRPRRRRCRSGRGSRRTEAAVDAAELALPRARQAPMSIPRLAAAADDSAPGPRATARTRGGEPGGRGGCGRGLRGRGLAGRRAVRARLPAGGAGWTGATKTDVIAGGLLAVAGFAGLFGVAAGRVVELYADARSAASLAGTADRENSGS